MQYVVTGAAGFIGSHLAEALAAAGHEVVEIAVSPTTTTRRSRSGTRAASTCAGLDLAEDTLDFSGFDGVFHLAGQPGVRSFGDVFPLYVRNVLRASASSRLLPTRACASSSRRRPRSTARLNAIRPRRTCRRDPSHRTGSRAQLRAPGPCVRTQLRARCRRPPLLQRLLPRQRPATWRSRASSASAEGPPVYALWRRRAEPELHRCGRRRGHGGGDGGRRARSGLQRRRRPGGHDERGARAPRAQSRG